MSYPRRFKVIYKFKQDNMKYELTISAADVHHARHTFTVDNPDAWIVTIVPVDVK